MMLDAFIILYDVSKLSHRDAKTWSMEGEYYSIGDALSWLTTLDITALRARKIRYGKAL